MGGGFGRKAIADGAIQAALIAKTIGRPVQLIWSREEDVRQDFYRPAVQSRFRAALDESGKMLAWENTYVDKHDPVEAPLIPYDVAARNIGHVKSQTHVPFGSWRNVDHSQHGFFTESFIDEVAIAAGYAIAPDGIKAQVESGVIYGLTAALYGEITIENGAVVQGNFADYKAVRMNEAPVIETHIINSGADIGGAGEPGTPGVAPALANAVYDATGIRVRTLPLSRFDLTFRVDESA